MRRAVILVLILMPSQSLAATAGPTNCGASADVANWTSDAEACGSNDTRATISNNTQTELRLTTFGFALDAGSTVTGITVVLEGYGPETVAGRRNMNVGMTKDGSTLAGTRASDLPITQGSDGDTSYGGTTSLWGTTWSEAEVEASTFGALVRHDGDAYQRNIDNVTITLTYNPPSTRRRAMVVSKFERPFVDVWPLTMHELPKMMTRSAGLLGRIAQ